MNMDEKIDHFFNMCEDEMVEKYYAQWLALVAFLAGLILGAIFHV